MKRNLVASLVFLLLSGVPAAAQFSFGSVPLDDVLFSAQQKLTEFGITDMTQNEFAAVILAPTWPETGAGTVGAPSPMTMSRFDFASPLLWALGDPMSGFARDFFHPGIGMWQFDSAGLGAPASADAFIGSNTAAQAAASEMARRWTTSTGTKPERRAFVWGPWFGCGSGGSNCESIFNTIYNPVTNTLSVTRDATVTRNGGAVWHNCSYVSTPTMFFSCLEVDPTKAQGVTSSWQFEPVVGDPDNGPSPLTLFYLVYTEASQEQRHWLSRFTGYSISTHAVRPLGQDARAANVWFSSSSLCVDGVC